MFDTNLLHLALTHFLLEDHFHMDHEDTETHGHPFTICTTQARWFKAHYFPEAVVTGYSIEENPTAKVGEFCGGHDFLIVGGRYIVDFWPFNVEGTTNSPILIDMQQQAELVTQLYGDRSKWITLPDYNINQLIYE